MLQLTSRRFLRELDEAPGGNNLQYIYWNVFAFHSLVTRDGTMKLCWETMGSRVMCEGSPYTKSAIRKAQEDMTRYYNWRRSLAPVFKPEDRVYLDTSDIKTTCLSLKLSHRRLGPFKIERQVGPLAYRLKLPHGLRQLHPVFNVVKLSAALNDPIPGRKPQAPLLPIVIDRELEWEVEEVLDSCWHWRRFQFLIK